MAPHPWYRHRWPWLLMLGPALVIVAGAVTIWLAITSDDGLVADDYYKRGLAINERIERVDRARAIGLGASVDVRPDGYLQVRLSGAAGEPDAAPASIRVVLAHPTRAGSDVVATLVRTPDGSYAARIAPIERGRWQLIVETATWRMPPVEIDGPASNVGITAQP